MPRVPSLPNDASPLARTLYEAMRRKDAEYGVPFRYTDLARLMEERTGRPRAFQHLRNVITGVRAMPDRETLRTMAAVLDLEPERLEVIAGWAPEWLMAAAYRGEPLPTPALALV